MVSAKDFNADWLDEEALTETGGRQRLAKPQLRERTGREKFATKARYRRTCGHWKASGMHRRSGRKAQVLA